MQTSPPTLCRFPFKLSASSLRVRKHSVIIHLQDLRCSSLIKSYVITRPLRLHNCASYIEPVHRRTIYAPRLLSTLSHLHAVALHFVAVFNSQRDLLPLAHAKSKRAPKLVPKSLNTFKICWCWWTIWIGHAFYMIKKSLPLYEHPRGRLDKSHHPGYDNTHYFSG